jgi:uncharacterized membrane protein YGL010W
MNATLQRPIDRWFESYSADHRNDTNQAIHVIAVPAILWSVVALIWCIPVFGTLFQNGIWAGLAMFAAWMFYNRLSRSIGYGMLVAFFTIGCSCRLIEHSYGIKTLLYAAISVFGALVAGFMWIIKRWHENNLRKYPEEVEHLLSIARSDKHH